MPRYIMPQTQIDPECLTPEGERRLKEIIEEKLKDDDVVEGWVTDNADLIASWINDPEVVFLRDHMKRRMRDHFEYEAFLQVKEEDGQ